MFEPGHVLGDRYEIEGLLGQGGMAHVFAAHDRHLDRSVALKVLRPHLTETDAERFRREIQALARLSHPGIVTIFDLGVGSEWVYFAMERIDGGVFTDLGPFEDDLGSQTRFLRAAVTVAETLGYVHQLGMVHRDLTPRNILMSSRGAPKLMDFGLVQLTESSRELTKTGFTLGTPHYMAPEQATGGMTDATTDIYAFGAVLYRTVTGESAFDAANDQAVLYRHVYDNAVPAIERNPLVPDDLSELIASMLEKTPERRPRSAFAIAETLRAILRSQEDLAASRAAGGASRTSSYSTGPVAHRALREAWRIRLERGPQWPAGLAALDGFILAGLRSDTLAVLRARDGGRVARFELQDEVDQVPVRTGQQLWVSTRDGALSEISWPSGRTNWRGEDVDAAGLAALGTDLLLTRRDGLMERWLPNKSVRWSYALEAATELPPIVHAGQAMAIDTHGMLIAVDLSDGRETFRVGLEAQPAQAAASQGILLLQERSGEIHGFALRSREVMWSFGLEGDTYGSPAIAGGRVYATSWAGSLVCISLEHGDAIWSRELGAAVTASPTVAAGRVWVVTEAGSLHGFEASDGREVDMRSISSAAIQAPALPVGGRLLVASTDGTVVAFD